MKIHVGFFLASAAILSAGQASAGAINTYQFVNNGGSWTTYGVNSGASPGTGAGVNLGPSHNFNGSNGLQATFTFYEDVNKTTGAGGTAVSGYHGHGLGVIGSDGSTRKVDNDGETIEVSFASAVIAKSSFYWGYGSWSDVAAFYWDGGIWNKINEVNSFSGYLTAGLQDTVSNRFRFVNTDCCLIGGGNDKWVLKGLAFESIGNVPEPGVMGLLAMGMAGIALGRRRTTKS